MKTFILISAVCLLAVPALAGWVQLNSGTTTELDGVCFLGSATGYVVCGGHVIKTKDGGATWDSLPGPNMFTLTAVRFWHVFSPPETAGCVVASGGRIATTTDGGVTWARESSGVMVDLRAINRSRDLLIVDDTSYVCGGDGTEGVVLKTTNSGQTWVHQSVNPGHPIAAVDFPANDQTGFASGWAGVLLKTTDGGSHWDSLSSGSTSDLVGICFPGDTLTGYVVGSGGTVLKTTNGGATWVSEPTGVGDYLASVSFPTSSTGYVCGASGTILKTTDGGSTWVQQVSGTSYFLTSIQFPVNAQTGYAVGRNGVILKTTDGGAAVEETKNDERTTMNLGPAIVHGVLKIGDRGPETGDREELLDVSGRKVLDLHSGANDVSNLAPGVYFCTLENGGNRISRKVVLTE